ncbi:hypothetical protein [Methylophaga sp. OBS4]|uniref:hypothetical protein n=1 Tax=Methylophaga sp. OBS4 TaxID=2991935 RepID=UPI002259C28E|nr:hypothetical protein [Methylophaga sp. OBS4]MCX4186292.1 hypothetical protein [Methylophaga sp. OBS4]
MRNLYSRLGIPATSSQEQIKSAIATCANPSLKADAEEVLLKDMHRLAYDRLNTTLTDIGYLRAELGLNYSDNWHGEEANDYTVSVTQHSKYKKAEPSNRLANVYQSDNSDKGPTSDWFV